MTYTVRVWDKTDGYVTDPTDAYEDLSWLDQFNGVGAGSVKVPTGGALASALTRDRIVEVADGGTVVFSFVVEAARTVVVGEAGTVSVEVSGRSPLGMLDQAVILPKSGDWMVGMTRPFNVGSPDATISYLVDTGSWGGAEVVSGYTPDNWPDKGGLTWITPVTDLGGSDGGHLWKAFTVSGGSFRRARIAVAATAAFVVLVDGVTVMSLSARTVGKEFRTVDLDLSPGDHTVAVVSPSSGVGVLLSLFLVDQDTGAFQTRLARTAGGWSSSRVAPSWPVGYVLSAMVDEAVDRGVAFHDVLSFGFGPTEGSDEEEWTARVWRDWPVGTTLLDLATDLVEFGCDVWLDHATRTVHAANSRGVDRSAAVALTPGENIVTYAVDEQHRAVSKMYLPTDSGKTWAWQTDSTRLAALGLREGVIEVGQNVRTVDIQPFGQVAIDAVSRGPSVSQAECIPVEGATPYTDFTVGDWITAPGLDGEPTIARVLSLSLHLVDGAWRYTPELEIGDAAQRRFAMEADGKYAQTLQRQVWNLSQGGAVLNAEPTNTDPDAALTGPPPLPEGEPIVAPDEPENPNDGDLWIDPDTGAINVWIEDPENPGEGEWVEVGGGGGGGGDPEVYVGADEPPTDTGLKLWVQIDAGGWVPIEGWWDTGDPDYDLLGLILTIGGVSTEVPVSQIDETVWSYLLYTQENSGSMDWNEARIEPTDDPPFVYEVTTAGVEIG